MRQCFHHMIFNSGQRYPEFALDFPISHVVEAVHDEYLSRALGQTAERQRQRSFEFFCFELMVLIGSAQMFRCTFGSNRDDLAPLSARSVDEQITRDPVKERPWINERGKLWAGCGAQEYILHEIRCMLCADPLCEIADKSGVLLPEHGV